MHQPGTGGADHAAHKETEFLPVDGIGFDRFNILPAGKDAFQQLGNPLITGRTLQTHLADDRVDRRTAGTAEIVRSPGDGSVTDYAAFSHTFLTTKTHNPALRVIHYPVCLLLATKGTEFNK
jgi:hypothetical protein